MYTGQHYQEAIKYFLKINIGIYPNSIKLRLLFLTCKQYCPYTSNLDKDLKAPLSEINGKKIVLIRSTS